MSKNPEDYDPCDCDECNGSGFNQNHVFINDDVYELTNEEGDVLNTYERWNDVPDSCEDKEDIKCHKCEGTGEIDSSELDY